MKGPYRNVATCHEIGRGCNIRAKICVAPIVARLNSKAEFFVRFVRCAMRIRDDARLSRKLNVELFSEWLWWRGKIHRHLASAKSKVYMSGPMPDFAWIKYSDDYREIALAPRRLLWSHRHHSITVRDRFLHRRLLQPLFRALIDRIKKR